MEEYWHKWTEFRRRPDFEDLDRDLDLIWEALEPLYLIPDNFPTGW